MVAPRRAPLGDREEQNPCVPPNRQSRPNLLPEPIACPGAADDPGAGGVSRAGRRRPARLMQALPPLPPPPRPGVRLAAPRALPDQRSQPLCAHRLQATRCRPGPVRRRCPRRPTTHPARRPPAQLSPPSPRVGAREDLQGKVFFFDKKKQKTFLTSDLRCTTRGVSAAGRSSANQAQQRRDRTANRHNSYCKD